MAEVFIVEDDLQDLRRVQQKVLITGDHQIETFVDAGLAVDSLRTRIEHKRRLPELIVIDLNLPENSGHEVLRFCKQTGACGQMSILVVSQNLRPEQASICRLMGARACLDKNASDDELEALILSVLGTERKTKAG